MSRKSLDSILTDVDEPEESPDNEQPAEIEAEAPVDELEDSPDNDEPEEQPEAQAKAEPKDKSEPEGEGKKDGLPPWMHAKLKAKEEKAAAAERQAQELQRQLEQIQQQQHAPQQPSLEEYLTQMQATQAQQALETRKAVSKRFAIADFGDEEVSRAEAWAFDACAADPALNMRMYNSDDPFRDAVIEFRKAQSFVELDKYGGDLEKLIEAKLAERGQVQTAEPASPQVQSQQQGKMPGNFSGTPSARTGRSGPSFTGPTPLGDLLSNS